MDNNNFNEQQPQYQQPQYQQPQYQQPQYQPYQQPEPPKKKQGLAIASLILGIVGLTICCCLGIIPGIIGLILGIIAVSSKQQDGKGMAIGGIITSALAILVNIILIVALVNDEDFQEGFRQGFEESYYDQTGEHSSFYEGDDYYSDDYYDWDAYDDYSTFSGDHFWGTNYTCDDGSTIYFFSDGTFSWYLDAEDWSDNVSSGTYTVVFGDDARELLTTDLAEYGVTAEELDDFHARNAGSDLYNEENLTVLILNTDHVLIDGEYNTDSYTTYYYGYSNEDGFDGANMDTANYVTFYTNY